MPATVSQCFCAIISDIYFSSSHICHVLTQRDKYEEALNQYIKGIEAFNAAIKWEKIAKKYVARCGMRLEFADHDDLQRI
jgi:hypothetical protein